MVTKLGRLNRGEEATRGQSQVVLVGERQCAWKRTSELRGRALVLEPNSSNTVSRYLRSGPFPTLSGHLLWSPVNSH